MKSADLSRDLFPNGRRSLHTARAKASPGKECRSGDCSQLSFKFGEKSGLTLGQSRLNTFFSKYYRKHIVEESF